MTQIDAANAWPEPTPTALLVLADGTVLEGFGLGAEGKAVGEVCFNTAMTGYEEILTDPSYAGQIITFTFPHIGNVGTNEEDIEALNMAARPGACGVILRADITDPSNYRATRHLDQWLKARGIIGLAGIDTRALTALIRSKGMPNAVIAHAGNGTFDLDALKKEAAAWPGLEGMDLVPMVTSGQRFVWDEMPWDWGNGYSRQDGHEFNVVAIDYGIKRNILRLLAGEGCKVTVVPATTSAEDIFAMKPDGVFLSNGPGDPAETGKYAVPVIKQIVAVRPADLRHLPRPPDAGPGARRQDREDASGPSRREPSGEGHDHRQGRDHLDEPRLCGGQDDAAEECRADACLAVRRLELRHRAVRQAGVLGAVSPGSLAGAAGQSLPVQAVHGFDAEAEEVGGSRRPPSHPILEEHAERRGARRAAVDGAVFAVHAHRAALHRHRVELDDVVEDLSVGQRRGEIGRALVACDHRVVTLDDDAAARTCSRTCR